MFLRRQEIHGWSATPPHEADTAAAAVTARRFVILGATGDLTGRYLLPALAELAAAGVLPADLSIVGVARHAWDVSQFRDHAAARLERNAVGVPAAVRDRL